MHGWMKLTWGCFKNNNMNSFLKWILLLARQLGFCKICKILILREFILWDFTVCVLQARTFFFFLKVPFLSPWLFMHKCSLHRKQEWWTTYLNTYNYINGCLLVLKASQTWLVFAGINNRIILGWPVVDSNRQRDHLSPVTYFLDRLQIQIPSIQKVACCIIYILYCSAAWKEKITKWRRYRKESF